LLGIAAQTVLVVVVVVVVVVAAALVAPPPPGQVPPPAGNTTPRFGCAAIPGEHICGWCGVWLSGWCNPLVPGVNHVAEPLLRALR
jgi:hypothetical protein